MEIKTNWWEESLASDVELFSGFTGHSETNFEDSDTCCMPAKLTKESLVSSRVHCKPGESSSVQQFPSSNVISENISNCVSDNDIWLAYDALRAFAKENGYVVHDIPSDGDCLFSTIAYQLKSVGLQNIDKCELRRMVADYLDINSLCYRNFVSQPVDSSNMFNADTEGSTVEDIYINSITDVESRTQLRWAKYINRLRIGAWGDHIALQGISDMLNVTICILRSQKEQFDSKMCICRPHIAISLCWTR